MSGTSWSLADAQANFAQLIKQAIDHGPQHLTEDGEDVAVILSIEDYRKLPGSREAN